MKPRLNRDGGRFNLSPSGHRKSGVCTELLGPSSLASTSKRGYNSVNKAGVLAESLHLEAKQVSCSF